MLCTDLESFPLKFFCSETDLFITEILMRS